MLQIERVIRTKRFGKTELVRITNTQLPSRDMNKYIAFASKLPNTVSLLIKEEGKVLFSYDEKKGVRF